MGALETVARIVMLGGSPERASLVAAMRAAFESNTGAFAPEDSWFEERSRAFWRDAVTRGRFGRHVEALLSSEDRAWLGPLDRAHRGLFRADGRRLTDAWSGAEYAVDDLEDDSRAELEAAEGQLFDGTVVAGEAPPLVVLLPGAVFHPPHATAAIGPVLASARAAGAPTHATLDGLLRMERTLRALSRVKASYAYRAEALSLEAPAVRAVARARK